LVSITTCTITEIKPGKAVATPLSSITQQDKIKAFQAGFCGTKPDPNSTEYIIEYVLPQSCEMPLGIGVDVEEDKIWYVSTKRGTLGSYNLEEDKFNEERQIPSWPSRNNPREFSQVWDVKIDNQRKVGEGKDGDVWFTDGKQNAIWRFITSTNTFERYIVPGESQDFGTTYPASIEFGPDNDNVIYFVGMFSPSIWIAEIDKLKNGTSKGISEIPIPVKGFEGIDPVFITTGSLAFDEKENALWVSVMVYGYKGQIFRYNIDAKSFDIFNLPQELSSPWGLTPGDNGDLWVTNAGSSIFYKLSPKGDNNNSYDTEDFEIEKFVTSKGSYRIFGNWPENKTERDFQNRYYTLPSMIKKSNDGSIWFNEQHGNKISKFDPLTRTLIEYWVPTQNRLWGICSNDNYSDNSLDDINNKNNKEICGIANVLQFSIADHDDSDKDDIDIWFSEWSQNKIGKVDTIEHPPFSIEVFESDKELTIERGEKEKIKFMLKAAEQPSSSITDIRMVVSGTFTSSGDIGNATVDFAEPLSSTSIKQGEGYEVSFEFVPSVHQKPGDYTLMIGAENDSISYLEAIKIRII
jgi:virginiamycin B lyase